MARSPAEIEESMRSTFETINPSLDLKVGPTWDYLLAPVPSELAFTEAEVERLLRFYSGDFPVVATATEARDFANNFGISLSLGERARASVTFFRNSPPAAGATLSIPVGTLVGTQDGSLIYRVTESRAMLGDFSDTYYNPTTNRYEIAVPVQATAPGVLFNVPPFRISRILSPQIDFDGISQTLAAAGGSEPESSFDLAARVIDQFKGLNLGSVAGVAGLARRFIPTGILDIKVIRPTDRFEFRRHTIGPALDLCVSGFDLQIFNEEYFAQGGELFIDMQQATATSVSQVSINSTALTADDWAFVPDTSPEYRGSTKAKNRLELFVTVNPTDTIDIVGTKNALLERIQALYQADTFSLFNTDVLVRSFIDLPIVVGIELRLKNSPNFDPIDAQNALLTVVSDYIEPFKVPEELRADLLETQIRRRIPNIDSIRIHEFRRRFTSLQTVEVIRPLKNEIPKYDTTLSSLVAKA